MDEPWYNSRKAFSALLERASLMSQQVTQLLAAANAALQSGRRDAAAEHMRAVLKLQPDHPQALNSLGVRALSSGDAREAAEYFGKAAASDPGEPALWLNLAKACRTLGDDEGESDALERTLAIDQRHFMAWVRMAEYHERRGEHAKANYRWWGVLQLAPSLEMRTAMLNDLLAHAQSYVDRRSKQFEAAVEAGLDVKRSGFDGGELRRFDACLDRVLGRRRIYTPEPHGIYFPFLPADEFFPKEHFPWMPEFEAAAPAIAEEFQTLLRDSPERFAPYVSQAPGTPVNKWTDLDRTLNWGACYLYQYGKAFEENLARCPATAEAICKVPLAELPARAPTAFFSVLQPRTRIPPHTGVTNVRATCHLPLIVPEGCGFRVGGETRQWRVAEAFAFDDTIEHEAWNDSDELRAVLIVDIWNPHLTEAEKALLKTFYETADASGHNPEPGGGI